MHRNQCYPVCAVRQWGGGKLDPDIYEAAKIYRRKMSRRLGAEIYLREMCRRRRVVSWPCPPTLHFPNPDPLLHTEQRDRNLYEFLI